MSRGWMSYHTRTPEEIERGVKRIEYPDEDGVYVISEVRAADEVARYVGKGNIKDRMYEHNQPQEHNAELRDLIQKRPYSYNVYCAVIENSIERANAEFSFFTHYGGINKLYNEVTPPGEMIAINPPF